MRSLLAVLSSLALFAMIGVAGAAEAIGSVQSVNPEKRTITLDDGSTFALSEKIDMTILKEGDQVTVSYNDQDGRKVADDVKLVSAAGTTNAAPSAAPEASSADSAPVPGQSQ